MRIFPLIREKRETSVWGMMGTYDPSPGSWSDVWGPVLKQVQLFMLKTIKMKHKTGGKE